MTSNDILDVAILVTEHLLDKVPHLLSPSTLEVRDEFGGLTYTADTFELQDSIEDALRSSSVIVAQIVKR
jgi:hypothetical protein